MPADVEDAFDETLGEFAEQLPWEYRRSWCVSPSSMDAE
jgi:hypothetical protein